MKYGFHPEALAEYEGAARYYAARDARVALRFIQAVEDAVRRISSAPTRWRSVEEDIRRCLLRVFPYAVLSPSNEIGCSSSRSCTAVASLGIGRRVSGGPNNTLEPTGLSVAAHRELRGPAADRSR
jgi:plasmid stabilization system protein ParE